MSEALGLERNRLLEGLPREVLEDLRLRCRWRRWEAGQWIIARATPGRDVLFVVDGTVRVGYVTEDGREVTSAEIGPGGVVGELAASDCRNAALPAEAFRTLLAELARLVEALPPAGPRQVAKVQGNENETIQIIGTGNTVGR